jgi:hypothetical protein
MSEVDRDGTARAGAAEQYLTRRGIVERRRLIVDRTVHEP